MHGSFRQMLKLVPTSLLKMCHVASFHNRMPFHVKQDGRKSLALLSFRCKNIPRWDFQGRRISESNTIQAYFKRGPSDTGKFFPRGYPIVPIRTDVVREYFQLRRTSYLLGVDYSRLSAVKCFPRRRPRITDF